MKLHRLQRHWERLAVEDPLWAILTDPEKKGQGWQEEEFFRTGAEEVWSIMRDAELLGLHGTRGQALDFGCGVGRLTQALAGHFNGVWGVDISPSMIELANEHNRHSDICRYRVNDRPDLSAFSDCQFDLILSRRVLQHIPPRSIRRYLKEFGRILAPGGLLLFDLPSQLAGLSRCARLRRAGYQIYWRAIGSRLGRHKEFMEMYGLSQLEVIALLRQSGCEVVDLERSNTAGREWITVRYAVTKESSN